MKNNIDQVPRWRHPTAFEIAWHVVKEVLEDYGEIQNSGKTNENSYPI
jgi:hypothetical protein